MCKKALAVDVGYTNMGLAFATCEKSQVRVERTCKVNLSDYKYNAKTNEVFDLVPLFVEDYKDLFDEADVVLIEKQPPGGLTNVECLLAYMFRDKLVQVNPVSLHTHFGMRHLDYEQRKVRTTAIAERYVDLPYERKHDVADAVCMLVYWNFRTSVHFFDGFRFS